MDVKEMEKIMKQKTKDIAKHEKIPLNAEGKELAEKKRKSFDLPTNAVKVDPLR